MKKELPKLEGITTSEKYFTITISESDLYHLLYRRKHAAREHNVYPDLGADAAKKLESILGKDMSYQVDLY